MPVCGTEQRLYMRIVCPGCNAQYEIDSNLLPVEGREVQCSACGNVWFQAHPDASPPSTATQAAPRRRPLAPEPDPDPTPERDMPDTVAAPDSARPASRSADPENADGPADTAPQQDVRGTARPVDEKVLGILREEAAFEAEQRARDASGLETQPDLGLLGAAPWPSNSDPAPDTDTAEPRPARGNAESDSRGAGLPDIEDISASLEPIGATRERGPGSAETVSVPPTSAERNQSFIRGLILPLAVALVLIALYLAAPVIGAAVPALAPVTTGYVDAVDGLRAAIAGLLG